MRKNAVYCEKLCFIHHILPWHIKKFDPYTPRKTTVGFYICFTQNISRSWIYLADERCLSLISLKSLCSIILSVLMPGNSFGEGEWNLAWLEFTDRKLSLRKGYSYVLHLKKIVTWFCTHQARMLRATREAARKNIPPLYFFWIRFVLKHLETKTTSVVLVAVCEQHSSRYFSVNHKLHILSLTAIQKAKPNAQLVLLDSRRRSSFSKVFALLKKRIHF